MLSQAPDTGNKTAKSDATATGTSLYRSADDPEHEGHELERTLAWLKDLGMLARGFRSSIGDADDATVAFPVHGRCWELFRKAPSIRDTRDTGRALDLATMSDAMASLLKGPMRRLIGLAQGALQLSASIDVVEDGRGDEKSLP